MADNYQATIVKIENLERIEGADRVQLSTIFGNTVVVSIEAKIGDIGLYFPVEAALSEEFRFKNNLNTVPEMNEDQITKGYFGKHGRVKAQTFRGKKSCGFYIPLESVGYIRQDVSSLADKIGYEFQELDGHKICSKYIPAGNTHVGTGDQRDKRIKKESKLINNQFRYHHDTAQLGKNMHKIEPDSMIALTWKLHGTSAVAANLLCKIKMTWKHKLLIKLARLLGGNALQLDFNLEEYDYLYASRNVIKNEYFGYSKQHYYKYDLWTEIGKDKFGGKLYNGESVYYEIVGYTKEGSAIQSMNGKAYDYGCDPQSLNGKPQHRVFVYRITTTSPDGTFLEYSWEQVKERCAELGVEYVPQIYSGKAEHLFGKVITKGTIENWRKEALEFMQLAFVHDQDSIFCTNKVPEEGIVVGVYGLRVNPFKLKSFKFLKQESADLDKDIVDIETQQSLGEDAG